MPPPNSNIYSQGYNFGSFLQKGVDPRTGQYTCGIGIYDSPAEARNCPPLKLSLSYNPLAPLNIGFGAGWSFNLSGYQHRQSNNKTLLLSTGEHYRVTEMSEHVQVNNQRLKTFHFTKRAASADDQDDMPTYRITHKSGLVEILSNANDTFDMTVPIRLYAGSGRSLELFWSTHGEQPRLTSIREGDQDLLTIHYSDTQVDVLRNPNTAEFSVFSFVLANDQLVEVRLPLEEAEEQRAAWTFTYQTFDQSIACLSAVVSPVGLVEEVQYKPDGHRLPVGAPYATIPYAISYTVRPGDQEPPIQTTYSYSDNNFLGYNGCNDWNDGEDNLYCVPTEYEYTSIVQVEGGTQTKHTYNKFHLMVYTQQQKGIKQVTQDITYHALLEKPFDDQPPQYLLPKCIQTTYRDTDSGSSRVETVQYAFDEWGNPTQEIAVNGIRTDRIYYSEAGEEGVETNQVNCPADPNGFRRYLRQETVTPAPGPFATPLRSKRYLYTRLPTVTGNCPTNWFVVARQIEFLEGSQCTTSAQLSFVNQPVARDHGRVKDITTLLSGLYPKTQSWTYQYPRAELLLEIVSTKFFNGVTVQEEIGCSLLSGNTIFHKDSAGNQSRFVYDKLGREVKLTACLNTPYEVAQRRNYAIVRDSNGDPSGCHITVTDAKGVQMRYSTDGLERVLRIERQDDGGQFSDQGDIKTYSGPFRLVQERHHNAQNQCIQVVDVDWLAGAKGRDMSTQQRSTQSFEYDDWGHICRVTKGSGVITEFFENPITLTRIEGIKGEGKSKTQFDVSGSPTQHALLRKDDSLVSQVEYAYDGFSRLIKQTDPSGHSKQLTYDHFDRVTQTTGPDNHSRKTQYAAQSAAALPSECSISNDGPFAEQVFDGFDRVVMRTIGNRTTKQSYRGIEPKPTEIRMPSGDEHHFTYNSALGYALTNATSNNIAYTYQYDEQTAATKQFKDVNRTNDIQYLPSGVVSAESNTDRGKTSSARFTYSMAGRLESYTDVNGQQHEIRYDSFGRPQQLAQGKLKVAFRYDKADHLCESSVKDEENSSGLITRLRYDDFGREIERTVVQKGESEKVLHQLSQDYDKSGLVASRVVKDGKGDLLRHESFEYDSLNRLVDYRSKGLDSWLAADEKGNLIRRQQFTFDYYNSLTQVMTVFNDGSKNTTRYTYSDHDRTQVIQIENTHPDYSPLTNLEYNQNGCLTRDERGRVLEYDTMNRLTAVLDTNDSNQAVSQYQYNAAGKLVCQTVTGQPDTHFSYRGDMLVAVTTGDIQVSYACLGGVYWGQTTTSQNDGHEASRKMELWASDSQRSVLTSLSAGGLVHQKYTPYGFGATSTSIGFNGQWRDPVTGWYHLGNGYRVYNPVLMHFHAPDTWSPFVSGEVNPYAYCVGDPVNRGDPSGHLSVFGLHLSNRDLIQMGVGLGVGILVGVLTGGAGLAIAVGVGVAAGALSDVATGAIYDLASGKSPTWKSVGTDAAMGAIGGLGGEVMGRLGGKGIGVLVKSISRLAERQGAGATLELAWRRIGRRGSFVFFDSLSGQPGRTGVMTHGLPGELMDPNGVLRRASSVARDFIGPALEGLRQRQPTLAIDNTFTLMACYGFPDSGRAVADVLRRPVRCFEGPIQSTVRGAVDRTLNKLEQPHGLREVFPQKRWIVYPHDEPMDTGLPYHYEEPMDTSAPFYDEPMDTM